MSAYSLCYARESGASTTSPTSDFPGSIQLQAAGSQSALSPAFLVLLGMHLKLQTEMEYDKIGAQAIEGGRDIGVYQVKINKIRDVLNVEANTDNRDSKPV